MSISSELEKLAAMRDAGTLSDAEFEAAKARILKKDAGGWSRTFATDTGPTLFSWALLALLAIGAGAAVFLWADQPSPTEQALGAGAILCLAIAGAVQGFMEEAPFAGALVIGGIVGVVGLGLAAAVVAAPFILIALLVLAAVGWIMSFFGDLFSG